MIRSAICKNCKEDLVIKLDVPSRHELEDELGRYFYRKCNHCHIDNEYHVNEVKAREGGYNHILYISAGVALFLVSTLFFFRLGLIWTATLIIPIFIYLQLRKAEEKSVQIFNQSDISRTRPK